MAIKLDCSRLKRGPSTGNKFTNKKTIKIKNKKN